MDHATLGALAASDTRGRVIVDEILGESDAYRRGLRVDDEIVRVDDRSISTVNGLKNILGIYPKDWRVPLVYVQLMVEAGYSEACICYLAKPQPGIAKERGTPEWYANARHSDTVLRQ